MPVEPRIQRFASADGKLDLAVRIYDGEGPVLLMMHGLTRNSLDFGPLAAHLSPRYRMIVPDQRGRGLSQWDPDPAGYLPLTYAQDMLALLDGLGITGVTAVGTSMGGLIAMVMNALRPEAIAGAVFNDIGPVIEAAGLARISGYVGPAGAMTSWDEAAARCRAINGEMLPYLDEEGWLAFARRTCTELPDGTIAFAYDPAIAGGMEGENASVVPPDLWPLWEGFSGKPVLVVRGADSDLLSAATVAEMGRRHQGPFAAVEIPGAGHAPLLDEPAALGAILPFLEAHAR